MTDKPESENRINEEKRTSSAAGHTEQQEMSEIHEPIRLRDLEEQLARESPEENQEIITEPVRLSDLENKLAQEKDPDQENGSVSAEESTKKKRRGKMRRILPAAAGAAAAAALIVCISVVQTPQKDTVPTESAVSAQTTESADPVAAAPETSSPEPAAEVTQQAETAISEEETPELQPETAGMPGAEVSYPLPEPNFENAAILGNSTTQALYIYGSLPEPDYYYGTGLTVETVLTETMPDSSVAIIDELNGRNYDTLIFAFGLNELGWSSPEAFIERYKTVIERARAYLPDAKIYLESVLPVGIETSHRNRFGVNQDQINIYNTYIHAMADEIGAGFLDVSEEFKDETGYLPQDISEDGIHPNKEGADRWAALIVQRMRESMAQEQTAAV